MTASLFSDEIYHVFCHQWKYKIRSIPASWWTVNGPSKLMLFFFLLAVFLLLLLSTFWHAERLCWAHHCWVLTSEEMKEKGSPQEQERKGFEEEWWGSERLQRYGLIDRRGRRKGQKPLGGGRLSQKELHRGTFYMFAHRITHKHIHTQAFASWCCCGLWLPLGGSGHLDTKHIQCTERKINAHLKRSARC